MAAPRSTRDRRRDAPHSLPVDGSPKRRLPARAAARRVLSWGRLLARQFIAHGMTVFAAALAYRGLLALVPFALFALSLIGLAGIEDAVPRLTGLLRRLRGQPGDDGASTEVPLEGLFSLGAIVGLWSMATGARLFMRALNAAHEVEETRTPVVRALTAALFLPALAIITIAATLLLLITSRILWWIAARVGLDVVVTLLGSWLRMPVALVLLAAAVAAAYRYAPSVRPGWRGVAAGAAVGVGLWVTVSRAFALALATVIDYGSTYGALGAAVALLVYLHLSASVLLLGAEVSALVGESSVAPGRSRPAEGTRSGVIGQFGG